MTKRKEQLFWDHARPQSNPTLCWPWCGPAKTDGTGIIRPTGGEQTTAARVAWLIFKGPLDKDDKVRLTCANPNCCSPHHLKKEKRWTAMHKKQKAVKAVKAVASA